VFYSGKEILNEETEYIFPENLQIPGVLRVSAFVYGVVLPEPGIGCHAICFEWPPVGEWQQDRQLQR
jgi:hypothetical protein